MLYPKDQVSILESNCNEKEYCWNVIYVGLAENQVYVITLFAI